MAQVLKVLLSPFYPKEEYIDPVTKIRFEHYRNAAHIVDLSRVEDLSGIRTAIRLNVLQIIEGGLPDETRQSSESDQGSVSDGSRHEDSNDAVPATRPDQAREVISDAEDQGEPVSVSPEQAEGEGKIEVKVEAEKVETKTHKQSKKK